MPFIVWQLEDPPLGAGLGDPNPDQEEEQSFGVWAEL